jgi:hypothetical protein
VPTPKRPCPARSLAEKPSPVPVALPLLSELLICHLAAPSATQLAEVVLVECSGVCLDGAEGRGELPPVLDLDLPDCDAGGGDADGLPECSLILDDDAQDLKALGERGKPDGDLMLGF